MEFISLTTAIFGLVISIISILTAILKIYKPIVQIQNDVKHMSELAIKREQVQEDHEKRIRELEIKSANCGCKTK